MKSYSKKVDIISIIVLVAIVFFSIFAFRNNVMKENANTGKKTLDDFRNATIAVIVDSVEEIWCRKFLPDVKLLIFQNLVDPIYAIETGNADCGIYEDIVINAYDNGENKFIIVDEPVFWTDMAFIIGKSPKAKEVAPKINEFIRNYKEDGRLQQLQNKWFDDYNKSTHDTFDLSKLNEENGVIKVAVDAAYPPFAFYFNNEVTGYDVEIMYRFCEEYNYGLQIDAMSFAGVLPGVSSGKYDFAFGGLSITDERKESFEFTEPTYKCNFHVFYNNPAYVKAHTSFIDEIKNSIHRTFIKENRYVLFLKGLGTTLFITVLSMFFGTILAFFICLYRGTNSKCANKICDVYLIIMQGTPVVVLLMVFYYIVFKSIDIPTEWVAIVVFTLNFAAFVSVIFNTAIKSVDKGQMEAALSLGYTRTQSFLKFVFPQSLIVALPIYKNELVTLIKGTSVVGYIAIQDLTKMSDIVRSRSFDAFMPLITIAAVYYIFSLLISKGINLLVKKLDWKNEKSI